MKRSRIGLRAALPASPPAPGSPPTLAGGLLALARACALLVLAGALGLPALGLASALPASEAADAAPAPAVAGTLPAAPGAAVPDATLGAECGQAAQKETAAGAKPKYDLERMLSNGFLLFTDSQPSATREALYRCSGGGMIVGFLQTLSTPSEAVARRAFADAKAKAQTRFGAPRRDSETAILPRRIARWKAYSGAFSVHESAEWRDDRESIAVTLQKPRDGSWQVITRGQPPVAAASSPEISPRLLASAASVALCSAAIVAALCLTPLRRFGALLAGATPAAIAFELQLSRSAAGPPVDGAAAWPGLELVACLAAGILACSMVSGFMRRRSLPGPSATPCSAPSQTEPNAPRWPLLSGLASLAAFLALLRWLFRPGHDPAGPLGGAALFVLAPATLLIAAAGSYVGTARLACAPRPERGGLGQLALEISGVLGTVAALTLCLDLLAEFALRP